MSYLATLTLSRAWLIDPADSTEPAVVCGTVRSSDSSFLVDGIVRQYDNGRRQGTSTSARARSIPITFVGLPAGDAATLERWMIQRRVILFRSAQGERFFVQFWETQTHIYLHTTLPGNIGRNITTTMYEVDYNEAV